MSIFNIFKLEVKRILKSKEFYTSIVLSLLFGSALVYTIKIDQGPFTINAVSSFYGIVATFAIVFLGTKTFIEDLNNQTIIYFFSSSKNRIHYFIGKLLSAIIVGLIFGIICSIFMIISAFILSWKVNLVTYILMPIFLYTLCSSFYILFFFKISIFVRKPTTLISLTILFVIAVPTILQNIILVNGIPESVGLFIKNMPFYFLTIRTKNLQIGTIEVLITIIGSGILFISNYYFITREDY